MDKFMEKIKEKIVEYLEKNEKASIDEIAEELNPDKAGLMYRDINKVIGEMESDGQVQKYIYYGLRPKGYCKVPEGKRVNKKVSDFIKRSSDK